MRPAIFAPLSDDDRSALRTRYLRYLRARDGRPDHAAHRFDVRESFFDEIAARPVRWLGPPPVSQALFDRHHLMAYDARANLDEATLWALCVAKANRGEKYGVEVAHAHADKRAVDENDPLTYIEVEEFYHTRILQDALRVLGLEMEVAPPPAGQRVLIHAMVRLPATVADVLVFCGEVVGVAIFALLLDKARTLFAAQPPALARIEALFQQIMVDEVGHVHFARSRLGPLQLRLAHLILPLVARGVGDGFPELWALFGKQRVLAEVRRADVDAAARPYPERFVFP